MYLVESINRYGIADAETMQVFTPDTYTTTAVRRSPTSTATVRWTSRSPSTTTPTSSSPFSLAHGMPLGEVLRGTDTVALYLHISRAPGFHAGSGFCGCVCVCVCVAPGTGVRGVWNRTGSRSARENSI